MSERDGVLVGGMHDGAVIAGMDGRWSWNMPILAPFTLAVADDEEASRPSRVAVYRLAITLGEASLDDCGRYRYEYVGTQ